MWIYVALTTVMWAVLPVVQVAYSKSMSIGAISAVFFALCIVAAPVVYLAQGPQIMSEIRGLLAPGGQGSLLAFAVVGVVITIGSTLTYLRALQLSGDRTAVVIIATCAYPVLTTALMAWIFNDTITMTMWIGVILIVLGCAALAVPSKST